MAARSSSLVFAVVLFLAGATVASDPPAARFTIFAFPAPGSSPQGAAVDSQGRVWYTIPTANAIGVFDPATEAHREFKIPTRNARPHGLAIDERGRVWFSQNGKGRIGRFDPRTERFREYYTPTAKDLRTAAFDQKGFLWIAARGSNKVVRFNPKTSNLKEFRVPTRDAHPMGIAVTPGRIIWFCEFEGNRLGRLDPVAEKITEFDLPAPGAGPRGLAVDENFVWFTAYHTGKLGRYSYRTGEWKEWASPSGPGSQPSAIAIAADGSVWYNEATANSMIRFDPETESFTTHLLPSPGSVVRHVARDAKGTLWLVIANSGSEGGSHLARID